MGTLQREEFSRRNFVKVLGAGGALWYWGAHNGLFAAVRSSQEQAPVPPIQLKYKTVPVSRLAQLKEDFERVKNSGQISDHPTYRKYIDSANFTLPEKLPGAKSIIVAAVAQQICTITFNYQGRPRVIPIPTGYVSNRFTPEQLRNHFLTEALKNKEAKLERARLPLKLLAVRAGLGKYGKNNICYVPGLGSQLALLGYFTDVEFHEDNWHKIDLIHECKGCTICVEACPTKAIRENPFVIDAGKCISLYNELPDPMPAWLKGDVHHALMGCMRCQFTCPANQNHVKQVDHLADVTEEETTQLLSGKISEGVKNSLTEKLKRVGGPDDFTYLARNLKLVLDA